MEQSQRRAGWLGNRPVQTKMLLALGLVLAVFVVGIVAALVAQDQAEQALKLRTETYETIVQVDELVRAAVDQQLTLRGYVITATPGILAAHDRGREEFSRRLDTLLERTKEDAQQRTRFTQVSSLMDRYWESVADPVLQWMEHPQTRARATDMVTTGQDGRYINEIRRELEAVQATEQERLAARNVSVEKSGRFTRRVLFALLIGGVVLGMLALAMVRRQITNPLVHLSGLMERLAAQDLGVAIPGQERRDEVGAIARALEVFKRMALSTGAETWVKAGVATIAARLQEARDYGQFAEITLAELAPRMDAPVARFYRFHPEARELRLIASRGPVEGAAVLALTEAAAAQAARQLKAEVQAKHYTGLSGGGVQPDTAVLRPVAIGTKLMGLIELGRAGRPELKHELLLDELLPIVALSFENLANAMRLQRSEENLQRANEALRIKSDAAHHQATHDPLTTLPNRLLFMARLEQAIERSRRTGAPVMLCYVDIDGFKPVNDRHGHLAGDVLLCGIAARLLEGLRRSDTVARLGGDEFVMLMEDIESESGAIDTIERLCRRLGEPYVLNSPNLPETLIVQVGASIGMALFPRDASSDDALMKAADGAMYVAKESGKGRAVRAADLAVDKTRAG